ncbi:MULTISPECIES: LCP family protein [Caproicibacterium]|uniref:LCP family protein n=1 Tax=Caproicibacterium argilliputei TaxID=3030016 RepID=A0AA97DB26_9FIRM|nr:LCP family protein [Caproicibacterium argilliputei]WOC32967.1 LCP family protein [Caproicibacterium argilliputei]
MATTPQNNRKRPAASGQRPQTRPRSPYPQGSRDIYSHSARPRTGREPMVDLSSYSNPRRTPAGARRAAAPTRQQQEAQVRYHDGFDPDDQATPVSRRRAVESSPVHGTAHRRSGRHHRLRNTLCILLVLLLIPFFWLTSLFSQMDRTHNTVSQSTYARTPQYAPTWSIKSSPWITNILLIGMDQDSGGGARRSDSMVLLSIDRQHSKLKMTSFLRDTYAEIPNHGRQKLNAAFAYGGPAMTMQTLENNYRIKIDKYIAVDFDSFSTIISDLGGIDVSLNEGLCEQFNKNLGTHFTPGKYTLKGVQALYYTRIRNYGNDYGRAERQREVIGQLLKKMAAAGPFKLSSLLHKILPLMWTNISATELAATCMLNLPAVAFPQKTQQIPADGTFDGKTLGSAGWVEVTDMEKNCTLLRQFIYEDSSRD